MRFFYFTLTIALFVSCCTSGQKNDKKETNTTASKEFYNNGIKIQTKAEYDSLIVKTNRRNEVMNFKIFPEILSQIQSGDSTIYSVEFHMRTTNNKMIGKPLPDFNFKDIEGKMVSLKDLMGKPIVINLWFVECPPCIAEMPTLNAIKERYSKSDIQFLSMTYEPKDKVNKFLSGIKINYRIIPNIGDYYKILASNFPQTIFINRQGIITDIQNGMIPIYDKQLKTTTDKMDETDFIRSLNAIK